QDVAVEAPGGRGARYTGESHRPLLRGEVEDAHPVADGRVRQRRDPQRLGELLLGHGGGGEPVVAGQHRQRQRRRGGEQGPSADAHQDLPSRVAGPPERGPISVCTASATRPSSAPVPAEVAIAGSISHSAAGPPPGPSPGIIQPTPMPIAPCSTPVRVSVSTGWGMRPTPTTLIHTTAVTERIRAARSGPCPSCHCAVSGHSS